MKKLVLTATAVLALSVGIAAAADMAVKAPPAAAAPPANPFDIAFGAALMSDYNFRGISQSNHRPSVNAYFEPRYNVNDNLQLYVGAGGYSIEFPNNAAAEIDFYGGIRPTFGKFAFDFGVWYYYYPGGRTFTGFTGNNPNLFDPNRSAPICSPAPTPAATRSRTISASSSSTARSRIRSTTTSRSARRSITIPTGCTAGRPAGI